MIFGKASKKKKAARQRAETPKVKLMEEPSDSVPHQSVVETGVLPSRDFKKNLGCG